MKPMALIACLLPGMALAQMDIAGPDAGVLPWQDAARVENGRQVYADFCAACHGDQLEGEPNWQERKPDGKMPAPPHDATGHTWHHADELLIRIVTLGTEAIVGGNYRSDMMGFSETLTPDEILDVLAYIKSTWPPQVIEMHDQINARAAAFD